MPPETRFPNARRAAGLRPAGEAQGDAARLWVASSHPTTGQLHLHTHLQGGVWAQTMARVPGAERIGPRTYAGVSSRGWAIPLAAIPDLCGEGTQAGAMCSARRFV